MPSKQLPAWLSDQTLDGNSFQQNGTDVFLSPYQFYPPSDWPHFCSEGNWPTAHRARPRANRHNFKYGDFRNHGRVAKCDHEIQR